MFNWNETQLKLLEFSQKNNFQLLDIFFEPTYINRYVYREYKKVKVKFQKYWFLYGSFQSHSRFELP